MKLKVLEWPSQNPDLNPIEMLWFDLKCAFYARNSSNLKELRTFCDEEWAKISPDRCQRLITDYRKRLVDVTFASYVFCFLRFYLLNLTCFSSRCIKFTQGK